MAEEIRQGSIFDELAERRSRNSDLDALAEEQGVPRFAERVQSSTIEEAEPEIEMKPAFDLDEVELSPVVSEPIQEDAVPDEDEIELQSFDTSEELEEEPLVSDGAPEELEIELREVEEPEPVFDEAAIPEAEVESVTEELEEEESEESVPEPESIAGIEPQETPIESEEAVPASYFDNLEDEDAGAVIEQPVDPEADSKVEEEIEAAAISDIEGFTEPLDLSEMIEQSDSLLDSEPETIPDAEVIVAAESLVDKIGPVVDIQSLPKTQPSRVMSKVQNAAQEFETPKPAEAVEPERVVQPISPDTVVQSEKVDTSEENSSKPKNKKKKKISLLDSYFKGL